MKISKITSETAEQQQLKMDRRKKRTSTNQYMMYIDLMEKDQIFATQRVPRDTDSNYLTKKWKELSAKLNTCQNGPTLTAEEWRKRLNDWKNTTRCKYRRSVSGEKDISLTSLELKALDLFGKAPVVPTVPDQMSLQLKCEKDAQDGDEEFETQRTSEAFQKELQAAVEEAIGGDDDEALGDEHDDNEEILPDELEPKVEHSNTGNGTTTTYRTIVVENTPYTDESPNEEDHLEFITHRKQIIGSTANSAVPGNVQTIVHTAPATTVTKLINGDIPLKRLRSHAPEQIIYEVKKAPVTQHHTHRITTIHNSTPNTITHHHQQHQQSHTHQQIQHIQEAAPIAETSPITSQDARELTRQLRRIANIKAEKLKFEIARYKFNNPGFQYNSPQL
ncbi:uncharacterized protein LOC119681608 [Teleopsis dalmanni]|uniref:uncharacterized protein LOC119681605 n=1 Tax=Teleopsis dalmanni TaxID=139649 RepID=UPI000D32A413|nr:uncharacterized protein LOC119681605 [Teleopsis dalmanni]XP_037950779.1 uncharacterized protein LOC119681608 [Teleopsis dalmanni]